MKKILLLLTSFILLACAQRANNDVALINLESEQILGIDLITNGTVPISSNDLPRLMAALSAAEYDSKINDSGIMLKMRTPDFLIDIVYAEQEELLSIWTSDSSARVLFERDWYILPAAQAKIVADILSSYIEAEQ